MNSSARSRWVCRPLTTKRRTALCGFAVGAVLSLLLVAAPLWLMGGSTGHAVDTVGPAPLAVLSAAPAASPQFDISAILQGEWSGEMCPDRGDPVPVVFEFLRSDVGDISYSLSVGDEFRSQGIVGSGTCDVSGEDIAFHSFLAILNECDEACGVDRLYVGHFEDGVLVGRYADEVMDELCASCVGGGSWWLEPEV